MEGLEELIDDMLGDMEEDDYVQPRYKDEEYLREIDIIIDTYEE